MDGRTRDTWDRARAERQVRSFYKWSGGDFLLNESAWLELRKGDPGLPTWEHFLALLEGSDERRSVFDD